MSQLYFLHVHPGHLITYKGITILLQEVPNPIETGALYLHVNDPSTKNYILEYKYSCNPGPYMLEYRVTESSKNTSIFYGLPLKIFVPQVKLTFSPWEAI